MVGVVDENQASKLKWIGMYAEVDRWSIGYSAMNSDGGGLAVVIVILGLNCSLMGCGASSTLNG